MDMDITEAQIVEHASEESYSRGVDYFERGAVLSLARRGEQLQADVQGSGYSPYRVAVDFGQDEIAATCSCPYDWGGWCKHIVAVMLAYLSSPERVSERPALDALLAPLDRDQLQALVQRLARLRPALADLIESEIASLPGTPVPGARPIAAVDPTAFRARAQRSVQHIQRDWTDSYWGGGSGTTEIEVMLDEAAELLIQGDARRALAMLTAIQDAFSSEFQHGWDEGDEQIFDFEYLAGLWTEVLLEADLSVEEREEWAERLDVWRAEVEDYADDSFFSAVQAVQQGWDHPAVVAALRGESIEDVNSILSPSLVNARLNVLYRAGRVEEYLNLSRVAGAVVHHSNMLIELGRVSEAANAALTGVGSAVEAEALAERLWDAGAREDALRVAETALARVGEMDYDRGRLASWLRDRTQELGQPERGLDAAVIAFQFAPGLANYQQVHELAGDEWPERRAALLDYLRLTEVYPSAGVIDVLLYENLIDDAVAKVEHGGSTREIWRVAEAATATHPDWVIWTGAGRAETIMNQARAKDYDQAIYWLGLAREAYIGTGRRADWHDYLAELTARHQRKYKLRPMLESLES
ncbi:MAG TPA: SWIM zinc finger family protein [Thermomicrobiaceae bacterium]|nr:SWIM zinc finger family protein [Thermomicrobiaceae bacterium]